MNLLNIIDTIYESKHFPTVLIISILVLVVLFTSVTILGIKDAKKTKNPKKKKREELIDITFDELKEEEKPVKEDVTFEIPILTQNLENFKKSLEEEIEREEQINVIKETAIKEKESKSTKILDKKTIESTDILPIVESNQEIENKHEIRETKNSENNKPKHKEALKEIFTDRKSKEIEPPKLKSEKAIKPEQSPSPKQNTNNDNKVPEKPNNEKNTKQEQRYSGDDDF